MEQRIELKADSATRAAASASVLIVLAEKVDNLVVASADLSNSDKTDGYLKRRKPLRKATFQANFPSGCVGVDDGLRDEQYGPTWRSDSGVRYVLHFSDYMGKPAVRLSALMRLRDLHLDA